MVSPARSSHDRCGAAGAGAMMDNANSGSTDSIVVHCLQQQNLGATVLVLGYIYIFF